MPETHTAQLDAMRAALKDACDLLEGWVLTKCPAKYRGEHMQHIQGLRKTGDDVPVMMRGLNGCQIPSAPPRPAMQISSVTVTWYCVSEWIPEDERMVQIFMPDGVPDPDWMDWFGWLGWYEHEEACWYTIGGHALPDGKVQWWAELTEPPHQVDGSGS